MEQTVNVLNDVKALRNMSKKTAQYRNTAIRWIKDASSLAHTSSETRDSSAQIFDRFMGLSILDSQPVFSHEKIQLIAAVSLVLSSKIHDTKPLAPRNFPHIDVKDFVNAEREVLEKLKFTLYPSTTPATFIRLIVWSCSGYSQREIAINLADRLVGDILGDPSAPLYAPSTIALAALLVACSRLGIDCKDWLTHVPSVCFPSVNHPIFKDNDGITTLDVDSCLQTIQQLHADIDNIDPSFLSPISSLKSSLKRRIMDYSQYSPTMIKRAKDEKNYALNQELFHLNNHERDRKTPLLAISNIIEVVGNVDIIPTK